MPHPTAQIIQDLMDWCHSTTRNECKILQNLATTRMKLNSCDYDEKCAINLCEIAATYGRLYIENIEWIRAQFQRLSWGATFMFAVYSGDVHLLNWLNTEGCSCTEKFPCVPAAMLCYYDVVEQLHEMGFSCQGQCEPLM